MTYREFYAALELIFQLKPNTIQGTEALDDLGEWDSLAKISFIAMADAELGAAVSAKALLACKTVQHLVKLFDGLITQ